MSKFEDTETTNFSYGKEGISFKDIILNHLKRISEFSSVEFRGGYWEEKQIHLGSGNFQTERTYVPDSREIYTNAVDVLADLLYPHFDSEMKKAEEYLLEEWRVWTDAHSDEKGFITDEKGKITNEAVQIQRNKKRGNRKLLFRQICCFLYRKKYLDMGSIEN